MRLFALEPSETGPLLLHEPGEQKPSNAFPSGTKGTNSGGSSSQSKGSIERMFAMQHEDLKAASGMASAPASFCETPTLLPPPISSTASPAHPHRGLLLLPERGPWLAGPPRAEGHGGAAGANRWEEEKQRSARGRSGNPDFTEGGKGAAQPNRDHSTYEQRRRRVHHPSSPPPHEPPTRPLASRGVSKEDEVPRRKARVAEDDDDDDDEGGSRFRQRRTGKVRLFSGLHVGTLKKASAAGLALYVAFCVGYLIKVHAVAPTGWRSLWGGASWGPVHLTVPGSDSTRWEEALQAASKEYLMAGTAPLSRMEGFAWHGWLQVSSKLGCDAVMPISRVAASETGAGGNSTTSTTVASVATRSPLCFCAQSEFLGHLVRSLGHIADGLNRSSLSSSLKDPSMKKALDVVNAEKASSYTEGIGACILRHSAGSRSTMLLGQWCASGQRWDPSGKQQGQRRLPFYLTLDPYSLIAGVLLAPVLLCNAPWLFLLLQRRVAGTRLAALPGARAENKVWGTASGEGTVAMLHLGVRFALLFFFVACSIPVDVLAGKASRTEGLGGWVVLVLVTALFLLALALGLLERVERLWDKVFWLVPNTLRNRYHYRHHLPSRRGKAFSSQRATTCFYKGQLVQIPLLCVLGDVLTHRRDALLDVSTSFVSGVLVGLLAATLQECSELFSVFKRQQRQSCAPQDGLECNDPGSSSNSQERQQQQQGRGVSQKIWRLDSNPPHVHAGCRSLACLSADNAAVLRIVRGFHVR